MYDAERGRFVPENQFYPRGFARGLSNHHPSGGFICSLLTHHASRITHHAKNTASQTVGFDVKS
ncbi:MAG TPA: hypothetical protein PKM18_08025, partial [bacterium]|nr:hypothetical protein [bacterium]